MTSQAVHSWVKKGLVPESVIKREGGKLLLDCDALEALILEGKLFRRPQKRFRGGSATPRPARQDAPEYLREAALTLLAADYSNGQQEAA
jgi:hypothetical protein